MVTTGGSMNNSQACPVSRSERLMLVTDGSIFSEGAIREAIILAKRCSSKLHIMSVLFMHPIHDAVGFEVSEKEKAEILRHLEQVKAKVGQEGISCDVILRESPEPPYKIIISEAIENQIETIIMGRRGYKGLKKLLIGELAAQVIGNAPCKVLVVPKAAKIDYRNLLVATDGSKHGNAAAKEAIHIAKSFGSSIIAISVCQTESELQKAKSNISKINELAKKESLPIETLTPVCISYDVILETAGGRGIDLIVMGAYGEVGLKKFIMGSSTEKVIGLAGCAVLVVKAQ